MTDKAPESSRIDLELLERAAEYRWNNPSGTWADIAKYLGKDLKTIYNWRQSEHWEIIYRKVASRDMDSMASEAKRALITAWRAGNPSGALEILRSFGLISNEKITVNNDYESIRATIGKFLDDKNDDYPPEFAAFAPGNEDSGMAGTAEDIQGSE
jgi:hypothetical protein